MEASPSLGVSGTRARTALLATTSTGSGSGGADRRVVFLASQPGSSHETRTWPHHWTPHTAGNDYKSTESSPHADSKLSIFNQDVDDVVCLSFWNAVDLMYRVFQQPNVRLNIAGIILAKDPNVTPYIANNRRMIDEYTDDRIQVPLALRNMPQFLFHDTFRNRSDNTMTSYNMCQFTSDYLESGEYNYDTDKEIIEHAYTIGLTRGQSNWLDEAGSACSLQASNPRATAATTTTTTTTTATATAKEVGSTESSCGRGLRIGVYGWRKRCLYFLVLGLTIIVILNLALTLWLLKVMEFSFEGMGSLKVIPGGIELRGQAAIFDALIASSVKSRRGSNLMLESWANFTASARGHNGQVLARFTLSEDKVEFVSRAFRITDPSGELLFSANNERVVVGAKTLKVTGVGGAVFEGSVQTPLVSSDAGRDLRLESATRSLEVRAPQRISVESSAGGISATCLSHLRLTSEQGAVTLESRNVFLKGLALQASTKSSSSQKRQQQQASAAEPSVYQLCACAHGKLFLAKPDGICQADKSIC